MGFNTERELVELFKRSFTNMADPNKNSKILEEVSLGFGIADLVISEYKDCVSCFEREQLTPIDINVYQIIKNKKRISFEAIINTTRSNKQSISKSLEKLIKGCFVKKEDSYYEFTNKYELSFKKSIAFEAKLRNWKKALTQAYRYKWFADYSYVVLDHDHSKSAIENIQIFKDANIGLITISTDGSLEYYHSPQKQKPIDPTMQILLSEVFLYSKEVD